MLWNFNAFPKPRLCERTLKITDKSDFGPGSEEIKKLNQNYSILNSDSKKELTVNVEMVMESS